jgi:hypothetical protein
VQACAQDVAKILDPTYKPTKPKDKLCFDEKQKYVYAVFEQKLLMDKGKALVCMYEATADAQSIYSKLVDHCTKSVKASLDLTTLMEYITTIRLDGGSWVESTASFILNWQDKLCKFEKLTDKLSHFSDGWKLIFL